MKHVKGISRLEKIGLAGGLVGAIAISEKGFYWTGTGIVAVECGYCLNKIRKIYKDNLSSVE